MNKSVLVIDTPTNCNECEVKCDGYTAKQYAEKAITKPSWCPLRPLPEKGTMDNVEPCAYNEGFIDGRNHCIELITGETE